MNVRNVDVRSIDAHLTRWLARYSVGLLRGSLGLVFLGFGVLKFFPGVSPAQGLAEETMGALTFGLIPGGAGLVLVAAMETAIGLSLLTGRYLRLGLGLLGIAMVGILSPLVLFTDELFARPYEPTLAGQYVIKDVVLLAAGLVVAAGARGNPVGTERDELRTDLQAELPSTTVDGNPHGQTRRRPERAWA